MQRIIQSGMQQLQGIEKAATTNTASTLATLGFTVSRAAGAEGGNVKPIDQALIYVETNNIRMGAGTLLAATGLLVEAGDYIKLSSAKEIEQTKFISAVAGVHATLHVQSGFDS